jgi:hypothetical protein
MSTARGRILMMSPTAKAVAMLPAAPARETMTISLAGFLKYLGSIGTGFAQPKRATRSISAPIGSR